MKLLDLADMPGHNPTTGSHGLHSVTEGKVWWDPVNKAICQRHGAMNCVNEDRTIWRCIVAVAERKDGAVAPLCGEGAYVA